MNRIQQISVELQTRRRREALGLDERCAKTPAQIRDLFHARRLEELKRRLHLPFAPDAPGPA